METQKINTALVILNWNGVDWLKKFLPNVLLHSKNTNIYIADNNSNDNSIEFISKHYPTINIIKNNNNYGFAKGYNTALKDLKEKYFILLNSDIEVTNNWINPIINLMESNTDISACQPKILDFNNRDNFEYAGASGGFIDFFGYPFCRGRIFNTIESDSNQYNDSTEIFWASGACIFIRNSDYWLVNGFDDDFFAHQEEIDLCWRLKNKGKKIMVVPESKVFHVGGGTLNSTSPFKTYLNFRNNLYMLFKNLPLIWLIIVIPSRLLLDGIAALSLINKPEPHKHIFSVLKAHIYFYINIPSLILKRLKLDNKFLLVGKENISIIFKYYIQKKKTFSDL